MFILIWKIAVAAGCACYVFFLFSVIRGLLKLKTERREIDGKLPSVSIIIPARDEEQYIWKTLDSIFEQDYPDAKLEVLVIDDRSEDRTSEIVAQYAGKRRNLKLLRQTQINENFSPKKQAIELGVENAAGEIIITTDADCIYPKGRLKSIVSRFTPETGMAAGQTRFDISVNPALWQRLQALDFQSQGIASAGLIANGTPYTCSGANLAFRRELFRDVGGYSKFQNIISGDDEFLMAKAHRRGWKIVSNRGSEAVVFSKPPATLKELWNQRTRWASKGLQHRLPVKLTLSGVFLFLVSLTAGFFLVLVNDIFWFWLIPALIKTSLDYAAVSIGSGIFREKFSSVDFLLLQIVHAPWIAVLAVWGNLFSFEWKGEKYRTSGKISA